MASNPFLRKLLSLQQDGSGAISAPSNWREEPLLSVETQLEREMGELSRQIKTDGGSNKTAIWFFLVGSPGNGKSAAVGKLYRSLTNPGGGEEACDVTSEDGRCLKDLEPGKVPYLLHVTERGNRFASAWIAQDASVVRDPFSPDVSPSKELRKLLEDAWEKGISLVVCTNWGVIERAFREAHTDSTANSTGWFKALRQVMQNNSPAGDPIQFKTGNRHAFERFVVKHRALDTNSLLVGSDVFSSLIKKATSKENWDACNGCKSKDRCPFRLNREWLGDDKLGDGLVDLLRSAEARTGQVIVFREAVALISFMLAGCPRDYEEGDPCKWVHRMSESGNLFALLSRRLYMALFAAFAPLGLETDTALRREQEESLQKLHEMVRGKPGNASQALAQLVNRKLVRPSADVGVSRILGPEGVMREMDPLGVALSPEFLGKWDGSVDHLAASQDQAISPLERECLQIWSCLEDSLESSSSHEVPGIYWALRRWSSGFTIRLGALVEGIYGFDKELREYLGVLDMWDHSSLNDQQIKEFARVEETMGVMLGQAGHNRDAASSIAIPLSQTVSLSGIWASQNLKPKILVNGNSLWITFGQAKDQPATRMVRLPAEAFIWLKRRVERGIDRNTFPTDLLAVATEARSLAAAQSGFAFEDDEVELLIRSREEGEAQFRINRIKGRVIVEKER